jgi:OPA family glycerol-3-phosphate transporter-like MFS transporter
LAVIGSLYLLLRLRDTPQSCGLPPIEEYRNDYTAHERAHGVNEWELSFYELFVNNVLLHKWIWLLAIANFFAYITRYAMIDWGPLYLQEVKGASVSKGGIAVLMLEWGGIPSTIFLGWVSDKLGGRRGMIAALSMLPIIAAYTGILLMPAGHINFDLAMLVVIGFFIYPVINLITIIALDLTSKKAIGTAAGFIGLLGYLGRTTHAKGFGAMLKHYKEMYDVPTAWNYVIALTLASTVIAFVLLLFTWKIKPRA